MITRRLLVFLVFLVGSTALGWGGDNTHTQGVSYAGRGFDDSQPSELPKPVPWFRPKAWPPTGTQESTLADGRKLVVTADCPTSSPATPLDSRFALCSGTVRLLEASGSPSSQTAACDLADATTTKVPLVAIRARWNNNQLQIDDEFVTFACAPTFPSSASIKTLGDFWRRSNDLDRYREAQRLPRTPSRSAISVGTGNQRAQAGHTLTAVLSVVDLSNINTSRNLGVLAKCLFWGFARLHSDPGLKTYQACVRAARADYCGSGKAMTRDGTVIQLYDVPTGGLTPPPKLVQEPADCQPSYLNFDLCFEALWNESRALCVSHARWLQMQPTDCIKEKEFPNSFNSEGKPTNRDTDIAIHCSVDNYDAARGKARLKNRSGINDRFGDVHSCINEIPCP